MLKSRPVVEKTECYDSSEKQRREQYIEDQKELHQEEWNSCKVLNFDEENKNEVNKKSRKNERHEHTDK